MKRLLLIIAFLFTIHGSQAQMTDVNLGVIGGVNLSNLTGPTGAYKPRFAGNVGLFSYVRVGTLSLETNILYSWQGAQLNGNQPIAPTLDLQYLKIGTLSRFTFTSPWAACVLHGATGLSFNILTAASLNGEKTGGQLNKFDLAIPVVLIVDFHYAELSMRYDISTVKISSHQRGANSVFSLNVAVKLAKFFE